MSKRDSRQGDHFKARSQVGSHPDKWQATRAQIAERFNQQYRGEAFKLPPEVEAMPIFRDWAAGTLSTKIASPFWKTAQPQKNQHCLDIGCGVSF